MLKKMADPLGEVCSVTRRLLRRGLGFQASRRANVFFLGKGQILFEQAMYKYILSFILFLILHFWILQHKIYCKGEISLT